MLSKVVILALFFGGSLGSVVAQSNDRLDELLSQSPARLDSTAYVVLVAGSAIADDASVADAFEAAVQQGLVAKDRHPEDPVTLADLSFLELKTLKVKGGLEWTFFPSPRAAYRELAYREVINTSAGPDRQVAGDEVLRTLSAVRALLPGGAP